MLLLSEPDVDRQELLPSRTRNPLAVHTQTLNPIAHKIGYSHLYASSDIVLAQINGFEIPYPLHNAPSEILRSLYLGHKEYK